MRLFRILALVVVLTMANFSPAQGDSIPDSAYVTGVTGHAQGYSLSCEARSAADWAAFWGVSIGEAVFLEALPQADNPDEGFVGYPNDAWGSIPPYGYGVHAGPVADTLQDFGINAVAQHDLSWDDLRSEINAGRPVIVWVIGQMWSGTPVKYEAPDGSIAIVAANEHTMILTGYSLDAVQVVDAYSGQYQTYWLKTFLKSWAVLGNMAVFGSREDQSSDETQPISRIGTYTVQPGDFLVALAERFSTTWQELAELNSIGDPYTIFGGQILQLPGSDEPEAEPAPEPGPESSTPQPTAIEFNFQAVLPVIQRNYIDPISPSVPITSNVTAPTETVVVKHADSLLNFGHIVGVDWRLLAKLNDLQPPYIVHPGQVLMLR
jgi:uncharacterized protein YvpB